MRVAVVLSRVDDEVALCDGRLDGDIGSGLERNTRGFLYDSKVTVKTPSGIVGQSQAFHELIGGNSLFQLSREYLAIKAPLIAHLLASLKRVEFSPIEVSRRVDVCFLATPSIHVYRVVVYIDEPRWRLKRFVSVISLITEARSQRSAYNCARNGVSHCFHNAFLSLFAWLNIDGHHTSVFFLGLLRMLHKPLLELPDKFDSLVWRLAQHILVECGLLVNVKQE